MQQLAKNGVEVQYFGQLISRPRSQQHSSRTDDLRLEAIRPEVLRRMESERVQPDPIASPSQVPGFLRRQQPSMLARLPPPLQARIGINPLLRYLPDLNEPFEQSERLRRSGAREMGGLAGVVGDETDGVGEGTELDFGCAVEERQAVGGKDGVEMAVRSSQGEEGWHSGAGLKDVKEEFIG